MSDDLLLSLPEAHVHAAGLPMRELLDALGPGVRAPGPALAEDVRREHGLEASAPDSLREVVEGTDLVRDGRGAPPKVSAHSPAPWGSPSRTSSPRFWSTGARRRRD